MKIINRPLEFYGELVKSENEKKMDFSDDSCPFLHKKCVKIRKSNKTQSIGSCIVGYSEKPLIICPHRFLKNNVIFLDVMKYFGEKNHDFYIVPEIKTTGGNIDYFLVTKENEKIVNYFGIEIQSLDTTSSGEIWLAREDFLSGKFMRNYKYGINWKMSAKTILIQMHHKGEFFEQLNKKLILVMQRGFFDYLSQEFSVSKLRDANEEDSIHFHIYDCKLTNNQYILELNSRKSTNIKGIEEMLNLGHRSKISQEKVLEKIRQKLPNSIKINTT